MQAPGSHYKQDKQYTPKVDEKAWGTEFILCRSPHAAKVMLLKPGFQVSMHWHADKSETFILISGEMIVELLDKDGYLSAIHLDKPFSSITISNNTPHTFYCPDKQEVNTVFIEASTLDRANDSYRVFPSGERTKNADSR